MDASVSLTRGEQENSVWNGHYGCTCYHPLFVFNQFGDLERCSLRPGNVHSADGWEGVLKPVVARYQGKVSRIYFCAHAGFANLEVYKYLEAEGIKYAIRLPENNGLQQKIGYLLTRPAAKPCPTVVCELPSLGQKLDEAPPRRRKCRMASRRTRSAHLIYRHQHGARRRECRWLLQQARHVRAVHQGGQGRH